MKLAGWLVRAEGRMMVSAGFFQVCSALAHGEAAEG